MKKILLTFMLAVAALTSQALTEFSVGQLKYYIETSGDAYCNGLSASAGNPTSITIPGRVTYNGTTYYVTNIATNAFKGNTTLQQVRVGWGVQQIGSASFMGCTALKYVWLPSSTTVIYNQAFQNCTSMLQFQIAAPTPPTFYGEKTFYNMRQCDVITALQSSVSAYNASSQLVAADSNGSITYNGNAANDFNYNGLSWVMTSDNIRVTRPTVSLCGTTATFLPITSAIYDSTNKTYGAGSDLDCDWTEIAPYACYGNSTLQKIGRSDTGVYFRLKKVGEYAFYNCSSLTEVNISAQEIASYAFYNCSNLATVNLYLKNNENYGTQSLGAFSFAHTGVTTQYIPQSLTTYNQGAFSYCPNLTKFTVSSSNTSFAVDNDMLYSKSFESLYQLGGAKIGVSTFNQAMTTVQSYACAGNSKSAQIYLHYGVKSIYNWAFADMSSLVIIRFPSSVTYFATYSLGNLVNVRDLYINKTTIPSNLTNTSTCLQNAYVGARLHVPRGCIGNYTSNSRWNTVFSGGKYESAYDFSKYNNGHYLYYTVTSTSTYSDPVAQSASTNGQVKIVKGYRAYYETHSIDNQTTLTIPTTVTECGKTYMVTEVDRGVFRDYTGIKYVTGGAGVKKIGVLSFAGTTGCTTGFNIPNPVEFCDSSLFNCWTPTITLGTRLERIGNDAFRQSAVRQVLMPPSVTQIGARIVAGDHQLDTIRLSPNITEIPTCGLGWCSARWIVIPYGVKKIGSQAFFSDNYGGGLDEPVRENVVVIPSSVTTIASDAFALARHLDAIFLNVPYGVFTSTKGDWFRRLDLDASNPYDWSGHKLYVPAGQLEQYRNDSGIRQCWNRGDIQCGAFDFTTDNNFWSTMYRMTVVDATNKKAKYVYNWGTNSSSVYVSNTKTDHNSGITYTMVEIGDSCWVNRPGVTSVTFPSTSNITRIGAYAFKDCTGLTGEISVPETVTSIGAYSFWNCNKLTSLFLNRTDATTIAKYAWNSVDNYNYDHIKLYVPLNQYWNIQGQIASWLPFTFSNCFLLPWYKPTTEWSAISVPTEDAVGLPASGDFYFINSYNTSAHNVGKEKMDNNHGIKGYQGMLFHGTIGTIYRFRQRSEINSSAPYNVSYYDPTVNYLKGANSSSYAANNQTITDNSTYDNYYFDKSLTKFYRITSARSIPVHEAYLQLTDSQTGGTNTITISDVVTYSLWLAGTQVTETNCNDLSVIDGVSGTAYYTPSTNTLTLKNATINPSSNATGITNGMNNLKIQFVGTNTIKSKGSSSGIQLTNDATFMGTGSVTITSPNYAGINIPNAITLIIQGGVKVTAQGYTYGVTGNSTGKITISGASTKLTANGTTQASYYNCKTTMNDGLAITSPSGAKFSSSGTVVSSTGTVLYNVNVVISKPAVTRGDVNGDGSVNISDVTALIDYLLSGNASGVNVSAADCNQDGSVNISDVTGLIDYLLSGSW